MNYKIGDIIRIKPKEWFDENKKYYTGFTFGKNRRKYYSKVDKIERILTSNWIYCKNISFIWHPDMFEPLNKVKLEEIIKEI